MKPITKQLPIFCMLINSSLSLSLLTFLWLPVNMSSLQSHKLFWLFSFPAASCLFITRTKTVTVHKPLWTVLLKPSHRAAGFSWNFNNNNKKHNKKLYYLEFVNIFISGESDFTADVTVWSHYAKWVQPAAFVCIPFKTKQVRADNVCTFTPAVKRDM